MIILFAKFTLLLFGIFFIGVAFLMLLKPSKAQEILTKAGSTNFINYAEISIRMIPAAALIIYSNYSKFPEIFKLFGWFMIITSLVLFLLPRKLHHKFSLKSAEILKPVYFQIISPFSFMIGVSILYSIF